MTDSPLISVVMPVWNGEKYLRESIDSILGQTFSNFEFIIINDGSIDSTRDILNSYQDTRLRVFHLDHAGIVSALNFGVAQAQTDWIARQDADDVSQPDRLEWQWRTIANHDDVVLCHTDFQFIDKSAASSSKAWFPRSKALVALKLCFQCPIVHSTVMFRKSTFNEAGGYRAEERHAEDYSLWTRIIEYGDCVGLGKKLISLRIHQQSVSRQNQATQIRLTEEIGIRHCERFLRLSLEEARRAHEVLNASPEDKHLREWSWFLKRCVPGLRWKSAELYAWLASQTFRVLFGKITPKREAGRA